MEEGPGIGAIFTVLCITAFVFAGLLYGLAMSVEIMYAETVGRPFYIHLYRKKMQVHPDEIGHLRKHNHFYNNLDPKRQSFFEHRLYRFLERYKFEGMDGFVVTDEVRIRIASKYIMLSFGWRNYLTDVFHTIQVFPGIYQSARTGNLHKGEFNPKDGLVIFSWEHFVVGDDITSDNLNLGIHEFTHIMHFHGSRGHDISGVIFNKLHALCMEEVRHPDTDAFLKEGNYFRDYAYTNDFEFLAVALEHFFETPAEFKSKFPRLYRQISRMLNYRP